MPFLPGEGSAQPAETIAVFIAFLGNTSHTTLMKLLVGLLGFLVASPAIALSESDLSLCESDSDCIVTQIARLIALGANRHAKDLIKSF